MKEVRGYFQLNDYENIMNKNMWDAVKAMIQGKCVALYYSYRKR